MKQLHGSKLCTADGSQECVWPQSVHDSKLSTDLSVRIYPTFASCQLSLEPARSLRSLQGHSLLVYRVTVTAFGWSVG